MRLQQMSSSQRERLAAENAEEGRLGYNMTERATGSGECKKHLASCLLTKSFACHSSPGMTLVLGNLIPFVISVSLYMSMYGHLD